MELKYILYKISYSVILKQINKFSVVDKTTSFVENCDKALHPKP